MTENSEARKRREEREGPFDIDYSAGYYGVTGFTDDQGNPAPPRWSSDGRALDAGRLVVSCVKSLASQKPPCISTSFSLLDETGIMTVTVEYAPKRVFGE